MCKLEQVSLHFSWLLRSFSSNSHLCITAPSFLRALSKLQVGFMFPAAVLTLGSLTPPIIGQIQTQQTVCFLVYLVLLPVKAGCGARTLIPERSFNMVSVCTSGVRYGKLSQFPKLGCVHSELAKVMIF